MGILEELYLLLVGNIGSIIDNFQGAVLFKGYSIPVPLAIIGMVFILTFGIIFVRTLLKVITIFLVYAVVGLIAGGLVYLVAEVKSESLLLSAVSVGILLAFLLNLRRMLA